MRKTLLLFTTMALALLLAAGTAWAAPGAPTVVSTVPPTTTPPQPGVDPTANITAQFSEPMNSKSFQISNKSTSTTSSHTFYLLPGGHFTAVPGRPNKNPPLHCNTIGNPCPNPIPATVSYNAVTRDKTAFTLNPTSLLQPNTPYTAVVEGTADGDYEVHPNAGGAVKDSGGTAMATDYIWHFTTGTTP
jgi:Bacterial Ig-like domain